MSARRDDTDLAHHRELFELRLEALGLDLDAREVERLWASYLKQRALAADWTERLDHAAEPALEFRAADRRR